MSKRKPEYGLLIEYECCTGCHACEVACSQEFNRPAGMNGVQVIETIQKLPNGRAYLAYIPFPTELCILCGPRTRQELQLACVQHCMAACMKYGRLEELVEEMRQKPRMVLWSPRA